MINYSSGHVLHYSSILPNYVIIGYIYIIYYIYIYNIYLYKYCVLCAFLGAECTGCRRHETDHVFVINTQMIT